LGVLDEGIFRNPNHYLKTIWLYLWLGRLFRIRIQLLSSLVTMMTSPWPNLLDATRSFPTFPTLLLSYTSVAFLISQ
jgi:hypothetical protein